MGCLRKEDWEGGGTTPRLKSEIFEAGDSEQFEDVLSLSKNDFEERMLTFKDKKGNFIIKSEQNKFLRNALFFYTWLDFFSKNNDLKGFITFLLQRTYLLPIELTGKNFEEAGEKALTIFETLNNRGKSLEDADIFKAKLYNIAKKGSEEDQLISLWGDLKNRCDNLSINIDDLFRYYSHVIRGKEGKTSLEINIRKFFIKMEYSPFFSKSYQEIMVDLFHIADAVEFIDVNKRKSNELAKWLQLIEIYTNQYPKFAVVVYLYINRENYSESDFIDFLKKMVRFSYYAGSTSTIKFSIFNIIRDICLKKEIDDFVQPEVPSDSFVYLGLLKYGYALLAFYLSQDQVLESFNIDKLVTYKDEKVLGGDWDKKKIEMVANSLGNFIVSELPKSNLAIDRKAEYLSSSKIKQVRELSTHLKTFSYQDFQSRDKDLRSYLFRFFQGKI